MKSAGSTTDNTEFTLIQDYFTQRTSHHRETLLGIGDDAALVEIPPGYQLATSVDTMVDGVHFLPDTDPFKLGQKLMAVNLSDLAAMGAQPRWATLALTLPDNDHDWLQRFSQGLFSQAERYQVDLIGGDTTQGPLTLTLQIQGLVQTGRATTRAGAQPGDLIAVTHTLGGAGYALHQLLQGTRDDSICHYLESPIPRIEAGLILGAHVSAMVDLSDGLLADLGHLLEASGVGAQLDLDTIPIETNLTTLPRRQQLDFALTAGDDYELCFTLPPEARAAVMEKMAAIDCPMTVIGEIVAEQQLYWSGDWKPLQSGYRHF